MENTNKVVKIENKDSMLVRYFKMLFGFFLFAVAIVITINAKLGYSPWDVFHQGLANVLDIKIGTANILVGLIIVIIAWLKGQKPGVGTIVNMFLIGSIMNILMDLDIIPTFSNIYIRILSIFFALLIMGLASYLYIDAGFGAGPRDGLMLVLHEKTGKSIRLVRNSIEITALVVGYLLGGPVGIGTVLISVGVGYAVQFVFNIFKFDTKTVIHRGWDDEVAALKRVLKSK